MSLVSYFYFVYVFMLCMVSLTRDGEMDQIQSLWPKVRSKSGRQIVN